MKDVKIGEIIVIRGRTYKVVGRSILSGMGDPLLKRIYRKVKDV